MTKDLQKWADAAMFESAPLQVRRTDKGDIVPEVKLLWMTPDPLGAMAAAYQMYKGVPTYSLADISDDLRREALEEVQKTHLQAPFEFVKFHFFLEGVTRSFTHQQVRQRTAVYAQESMRFAVVEDLVDHVATPPSIASTPANSDLRVLWADAMANIESAYNVLIANGIPAEDARGLLPHAVATRDNYCTDLMNLVHHAGNRLCTQAQFEWRAVFMQIVNQIRTYTPDFSWAAMVGDGFNHVLREAWEDKHRWQFEAIADSNLFRPICYQLGRCPVKSAIDRGCTIRTRVDERTEHGGKDSSQWHKPFLYNDPKDGHVITSQGIDPAEWLLDPRAAIVEPGARGGHE